MKSITITILMLLAGYTTICWSIDTYQVLTAGKTLEIKAAIIPEFRKFDDGKSKIEGKIMVTNKASVTQKFGNQFLSLKVNGKLIARTYKDTVASDVIDFATIDIKPHSSLSLPVYWVFNVPTSTKIDSVQLILDEEGLEKEMHRIPDLSELLLDACLVQ